MDDRYLILAVPNTDLIVIVKLDDEGVIVDIAHQDNDEPIASTWKFYHEFGLEVKERNEN